MESHSRKNSWLTIGVNGCCASRDDVASEKKGHNGRSAARIYDQPQAMPVSPTNPLAPRPTTGQMMSQHISQWVTSSREYAARASSRASLSTLTRPKQSHSRPSISAPTNFRHFDGFDSVEFMVTDAPSNSRRRSFRPLQLSIYGSGGHGQLSPLPNFHEEDSWSQKPSPLSMPAPARVRGGELAYLSNPSSYSIPRKPVGSGSRRASVQSVQSMTTHERRFSGSTVGTVATPALPSWSEEPKASVESVVRGAGMLRRSRTSASNTPARVLSRLPSPSRNRANTAPSRPASLRRANTDVDEAIRELNTIVEERRASTYRSQIQAPALNNRIPPSPSHHVPHFAPSMRMHVRSETLSDIGSAFSVPLVNKALPSPPSDSTPALRRAPNFSLYPPARNFTGPLTSNPITPPPPKTASSTSTTSLHRLSNWLRRSSSRPTTPKAKDLTPFYKVEVEVPTLPVLPSRASTVESRTTYHVRQDSQDSNDSTETSATTVTLVSSYSMTRSASPEEDLDAAAHARADVLKGNGRQRRIPAPLVFNTGDKDIEAALATTTSTRSTRGLREMWPPVSPHSHILPGQELFAKEVGLHSGRRFPPSPHMHVSMVGVAF
ncbi:hypothetical protein C7974DRAFT_394500 [Boeremia exigua]|uniref:uncharacterized protein n=1 Tax=Boeremia exigua TaxID=749465 RepID=UPI001E8D367E|nr:uncharacterized protein C7974DRAFT_394500 [Boeremia exigua]KAH6629451.1 hypothetical protein C7974DRAFT_394500 [Boeremia exigua]